MSQSSEIEKLSAHIEELEYRLEKYHEHLVEAVDQRDILALDAAWGTWRAVRTIETSLVALLAGGFTYLMLDITNLSSTWVYAASIGVFAISSYCMGQSALKRYVANRNLDRAALEQLPEWQSRAHDLWESE